MRRALGAADAAVAAPAPAPPARAEATVAGERDRRLGALFRGAAGFAWRRSTRASGLGSARALQGPGPAWRGSSGGCQRSGDWSGDCRLPLRGRAQCPRRIRERPPGGQGAFSWRARLGSRDPGPRLPGDRPGVRARPGGLPLIGRARCPRPSRTAVLLPRVTAPRLSAARTIRAMARAAAAQPPPHAHARTCARARARRRRRRRTMAEVRHRLDGAAAVPEPRLRRRPRIRAPLPGTATWPRLAQLGPTAQLVPAQLVPLSL